MLTFHKFDCAENGKRMKVYAPNGATLYVEIKHGRVVYASTGHVYTGTWALGCNHARFSDIRRTFRKLCKLTARPTRANS